MEEFHGMLITIITTVLRFTTECVITVPAITEVQATDLAVTFLHIHILAAEQAYTVQAAHAHQ